MQIFMWHLSPTQHQPKKDHSNIPNKEARERRRRLRAFTSLCRKDVAIACSYSTMNKMKKQHIIDKNSNSNKQQETTKSSNNNHLGNNKVLPVTDDNINTTTLKYSSTTTSMSRIKDLFRWAAYAKSHNKSKSNFLGTKDEKEEESNYNNETIRELSLRWEVESNSTICSSMASSQGNWITTDPEFVVLEL